MMNSSGKIHIYTGDGKGKTTAAIGLGLRAFGRGWKVVLMRFLKNQDSGEVAAITALGNRYRIESDKSILKFTWSMSEEERMEAGEICRRMLERGRALMNSGLCDMLILDEALGAIHGGFLTIEDLCGLMQDRPASVELVLTGRNAPEELVSLADYVSEIHALKHPMDVGTSAREGVEY